MKFAQLFQFTFCVFIICALTISSACNKDTVDSTSASTKCDYAPYSNGSKFVYSTSSGQPQTAIDTIPGDTTINGKRYARVWYIGPSLSNALVSFTTFTRCDANGIYILIDKFLLGQMSMNTFVAKEIQTLKLPASVGLSWQSDSIKYINSQGANVAVVYKMKETAVGGTKTENGTVYANSLVTAQVRAYTKTTFNGSSTIDSFTYLVNTVYDKTFGVIEASGSIISKNLKSSIIK